MEFHEHRRVQTVLIYEHPTWFLKMFKASLGYEERGLALEPERSERSDADALLLLGRCFLVRGRSPQRWTSPVVGTGRCWSGRVGIMRPMGSGGADGSRRLTEFRRRPLFFGCPRQKKRVQGT